VVWFGLVKSLSTPLAMTKITAILLSPFIWIKDHWKLSLVLLVAAAGFGFWQWQQLQAAKPVLTFQKPTQGNLIQTLEVSGLLDATQKASLRFAAGGKVVYVGAQAGDYVKKGQTLATIDRRELEKRLQQDLNSYMRERWDWDQLQDDTKDRALPQREVRGVDKAQWDLDDTVLDVEIRDIAIRNTVLSSPIAGILVSSPTTVAGVNLAPADTFDVIDPSSLVFKAAVDEADVGKIKIGQPVKITLDAFPDQTISSAVNKIDVKSSQSNTGTVFVVEIPIPNVTSLEQYRLGMNGDVTIELATRENVMSVPLDAIRQREDKTFVDVRTGPDTYAEREIEVDLETDDAIEVIKGLSKDDEILIP
jgi:HlyD family secretion protein